MSTNCPLERSCRSREHSGQCVFKICLSCFLQGGVMRRYDYNVSSLSYQCKRGGSCTTLKADEPGTVVERANGLLEHNDFGNHNLLDRNCEDFALFCSTGDRTAKSNQVPQRYESSIIIGVGFVVAVQLQPPHTDSQQTRKLPGLGRFTTCPEQQCCGDSTHKLPGQVRAS